MEGWQVLPNEVSSGVRRRVHMELSGRENVRSVEGPMDLRILWVYEGILLADLSSDLAFFWSKEGVR